MIPKMDYVIVTYNDIDTIRESIASIRRQGNVNRLIVVASERCTDGTLDLMKDFKLNNVAIDVLLTENIGLAHARKMGIEEVETKWFVFVDGDVVLSDTWVKEMYDNMQYCENFNLGAMYGYLYRNKEQEEDLKEYSKTRVIKRRMFTHNTIIRTDLVKDWEPDENINAYEDYLITQHIIDKGYMIFNVRVLSFHNHIGSPWKEATWGGAGARASGYYKNVLMPIKKLIGSIYGGLVRTMRRRKSSFLKISVIKGFGTLWGYLRWRKYILK